MNIRTLASLALLVSSGESFSETVPQLTDLTRDPAVDPSMDDLKAAVELRVPLSNEVQAVRVKLASRKSDVVIAIQMARALKTSERLRLGLRFVNAGASGRSVVFGPLGVNLPESQASMSSFVKGAVKNSRDVFLARAWLAAKALPRFPAKGLLLMEVCATVESTRAKTEDSHVCFEHQAAVAIRFPDEFRKNLQLKLDERVIAVEGRPKGWVGYPALALPIWLQGDVALEAATVRELAKDEANQLETLEIPLPKRLATPDGRALVPVFMGRDPTSGDGKCDSNQELRLGLYAVKGLNAVRTLEWPAANCTLGRAVTVVLNDDGDLTIGYGNGATASFVWSGDHFERTEIGVR